jgi:glycosyltransferase involved in cell wall biosynthesis
MKIVIISTFEINGGAAVAAKRLMCSLRKSGYEACMLVRDRQTEDPYVESVNTSWLKRKMYFILFCYERLVIFIHNCFSRKHLFDVSIANTGVDISRHPLVQDADILHIHWINQGFLSLKNIRQLQKLNKPIIWTMHDMWCFTGICHYAGTCRKYQYVCQNCEILKNGDIAQCVFEKKRKNLRTGIKYVGCSKWIADIARQSKILQNASITNIPNPIDKEIFTPKDKTLARQKFHLPLDKKLILFAAAKLSDTRKGISYFIDACKQLDKDIEIVFMGGKIDESLINSFSQKTHQLGYLNSPEDITYAYSSCNVFVIPSLEDNLPNTIMEAMSCGTPCVGFNIGGIPEMIDHKENGYVAEYKNAEDLADGIIYCIENKEILSKKAREKVLANYSEAVVAEKYISLYKELLEL